MEELLQTAVNVNDVNVTWSVRRLRHSRPHDAPASSRGVVWRQQHRAQMVCFVSQPSSAVCLLWVNIIASKGRSVRCPARADPLPALYSRPDWSSWDTRAACHRRIDVAAATSLCRWHADFWLLSSMRHCTASEPRVCVCWWCRAMDTVQLAAAQHDKKWRSVVCVVSSTASDSRWTIEGGLDLVQPIRSVSKSGYPSWLCWWTLTSHELFPAVLLFCYKYAASVNRSLFAVSCSRSSCHWSFHGWTMVVRRWPAFLLSARHTSVSSVCLERCSASDLQIQEIWPRDAAAARPSLLRIPERITFRLAVLAYRCQKGLARQYLADYLHKVAEVESRGRSTATVALMVPGVALSLSLLLGCGTAFRSRLRHRRPLSVFLLRVLVYSCFMYRGLAILWLYAMLILFV